MTAEIRRITVSLPRELHRKARILSVKRGIALSAICRHALAEWVQQQEAIERKAQEQDGLGTPPGV